MESELAKRLHLLGNQNYQHSYDTLWMYENIIPNKGVGIITGESKSGKSLVALDLALAVSTGTLFGGEFTDYAPHSALYFDSHNQENIIQQRASRILAHRQMERSDKLTLSKIPFAYRRYIDDIYLE